MNTTAHFSPAAQAYAQSLLELAGERGGAGIEQVGQELEGLAQVLKDNRTFQLYLADPGIATEERDASLTAILGGRVSPVVVNFLRLLNQKNRLKLLAEILAAYAWLLEKKLGRVRGTLTVASPLSAGELADVAGKVSKALGKTATLDQKVDDAIIGGLVLQVEDKIIDASVRQQLKSMKSSFLASAPR